MARLVLLSRDGVLVGDRVEGIRNPGDLALLPGAGAALRRLNEAGLKTIALARQPGAGGRPVDEAMQARLHDDLRDRLMREGARLDMILNAPDPAGGRTAPASDLLNEAMRRFTVAAYDCVMIGHTLPDLQAATAADVARILVRTGRGQATQAAGIPRQVMPLRIAADLGQAADFILGSGEGG